MQQLDARSLADVLPPPRRAGDAAAPAESVVALPLSTRGRVAAD
jgi:hypothetical protein